MDQVVTQSDEMDSDEIGVITATPLMLILMHKEWRINVVQSTCLLNHCADCMLSFHTCLHSLTGQLLDLVRKCSYQLTSCWPVRAVLCLTHSMQSVIEAKVKEADLYNAFIEVPYTRGAQVRITRCYLQITPYLPLPRKHSPDGASQTEVADI